MSRLFFYKSTKDILARLPKFYVEHYKNATKQAIDTIYYEKPKDEYFRMPDGQLHHSSELYHPPIMMKSIELNNCIIGKEGIISGRHQKKKGYPKDAIFITPKLEQHLFYSEVLQLWLKVIVTKQVLKDIEEARSFDLYILECRDAGMEPNLVNNLKRRILLRLADHKESKTPDSDELIAKYSKFILPKHEAEWIGLSLEEAVDNQIVMDALNESDPIPLKITFTKEFLKNLKEEKETN